MTALGRKQSFASVCFRPEAVVQRFGRGKQRQLKAESLFTQVDHHVDGEASSFGPVPAWLITPSFPLFRKDDSRKLNSHFDFITESRANLRHRLIRRDHRFGDFPFF